ncbi:hypothetical protein ANO11243_087100 [Dothideomycetidae sp. 11243]|nr:hypothetical protein ANO11243_087100 [fungal sp. No.11243]
MDVKLYVYDLSRGMARAMSQSFLGTQIDAIYHTSVVYNNVEYFFGQGIQQSIPGATHHGQPMEVVHLGRTQLPPDVVLEYLESMKTIYTPEAYDLFQNNCNNFSNDFSQFLVGKGIPDHIVSLPKTVLDTPFGQMLKPQLDASMRSITQAPLPSSSNIAAGSATNGTVHQQQSNGAPAASTNEHGSVYHVIQPSDLDRLLSEAKATCATVFFTSSTCAPCRLAYPTFDALAGEHPRAVFIKIDINSAHSIAAKYSIRATPTFMTFLRGSKADEWTGADPSRLRSAVSALVAQACPAHPHAALDVRSLRLGSLRPVTFPKIPPLDKLVGKLGDAASDPAVQSMRDFVHARSSTKREPASIALPNLQSWASFLSTALNKLAPETLFALFDLLRCTILDPRVSGWFAADSPGTIEGLVSHVSSLSNSGTCPYPLRLVTLQLIATLFSSPLWTSRLCRSQDVLSLTTSALLHSPAPPALRGAAASLAFNLAATNHRARREKPDEPELLPSGEQVELIAALVEMFATDDEAGTKEGGHAALVALGLVVYFAEEGGEVFDLCTAVGAKTTLEGVKAEGKAESVRKDVVQVLPA